MNILNNLRNKYVLLVLTIIISLLVTSLCMKPVSCGSEAAKEMEETTTEAVITTVVSTTTTTVTTTTTEITTTSDTTETTTTTTTTIIPITEEPIVQVVTTANIIVTEEPAKVALPTEETVEDVIEETPTESEIMEVAGESISTPVTPYDYGLTEYEVMLLRKLVSSEYGADWVPVEEKAKIVASIMNRVRNSGSNISDVIATACEPWGFNRNYNYYMSDSIIAAVDYYFANKDTVFANWTATSWYGNGRVNTFY